MGLKYAGVVNVIKVEADNNGQITNVFAEYLGNAKESKKEGE